MKGKLLHPIHWGTFNLALHPWYEPMQRLAQAARSNQIPIATPMVGETIALYAQTQGQTLGSPWWEKSLGKASSL